MSTHQVTANTTFKRKNNQLDITLRCRFFLFFLLVWRLPRFQWVLATTSFAFPGRHLWLPWVDRMTWWGKSVTRLKGQSKGIEVRHPQRAN